MKNVRFVGLDVHAETIAVAVAESGGEVRSLGTIPNRFESVARLIRKLGKPEHLRVCYEAGPTGYALYWELTRLGVKCEVVAASMRAPLSLREPESRVVEGQAVAVVLRPNPDDSVSIVVGHVVAGSACHLSVPPAMQKVKDPTPSRSTPGAI